MIVDRSDEVPRLKWPRHFPVPRNLGMAALRISAVALVPLVLWLVVALAGGAVADHVSLAVWLAAPLNAVLMILLLVAGFHHAALGLQVIAEDYIHSGARFAAVAVIQLACIAGAAAGIVAVLRIALSA